MEIEDFIKMLRFTYINSLTFQLTPKSPKEMLLKRWDEATEALSMITIISVTLEQQLKALGVEVSHEAALKKHLEEFKKDATAKMKGKVGGDIIS